MKKVYRTEDGKFAVAYEKDQVPEVKDFNRVACWIYTDQQLTKRYYNRLQIISLRKLTLIPNVLK